MPGLAIIIDRAGTGELLRPLHSAGLTDYAARYYVSTSTPPTKLSDRVGSDHLTSPTTTGLTVNTSGTPFLSAVGGARLDGSAVRTGARSFAAVIRTDPTAGGARLNLGGSYNLSIPGNGNWQITLPGGGDVTGPVVASATAWHLVIGSLNGTSTKLWINTNNTTGAVARIPATPLPIVDAPLAIRSHSTAPTQLRELITWNRAITEADRDVIRTALRAHHTDIPA